MVLVARFKLSINGMFIVNNPMLGPVRAAEQVYVLAQLCTGHGQ
jgi:hypothetical protein